MAEAARDPWNAPADIEVLRALLPADHPDLADRGGPRPAEFAPGALWVTLIDLPSVPRGTVLQLLRYRTWVD